MNACIKIYIPILTSLLLTTTSWAEQTYARLSFWIKPTQYATFEKSYIQKAIPILKTYGLNPSSKQGRKVPNNIFSRLLTIDSPAQFFPIRSALGRNSAWLQLIEDFGTTFSPETPDAGIEWRFEIYHATPIPDKIVTSGRTIPTGAGKSHQKIYTTAHGLSGADISGLLQDRNGDLWIATYGGGVHRFDGQKFTNLTVKDGLANMAVHAVYEDRQGNLWFGTQGGASRFDGKNWKTFSTKDGLVHNWVFHILQDSEGMMWFGTFGYGVSRFDGENWKTFTTQDGLPHNSIKGILQDKKGDLWFDTLQGACRFDGQVFTALQPRNVAYISSGVNRHGIFQDRDGNIWFSTGPDSVMRYDGQTMTHVNVDEKIAKRTLYPRIQDQEGNLWFETAEGPVSYDGKTWNTFAREYGLNTRATTIIQDRDGNFWFQSGLELVQYTNQSFWSLTPEDGVPPSWVRSVVQDKNKNFWFGTFGDGFAHYNGKTLTMFARENGLPGDRIRLIYRDKQDNLWIGGSGNGVLKYDGQTFHSFLPTHGLPGPYVYAICQDRDHNMWLSTWRGGVTRYDGKHLITFSTADGLTDNIVRDIHQDREGNMWFATHAGVTKYDGQTFTPFPLKDIPQNLGILSLFQDRNGIFWFGTWHGGLVRYNPSAKSEQEKWKTFTTQDGLVHNDVWSIFQDKEGHLWFSTGGGISRYDGQCFQNLTTEDGLAGNRTEAITQDDEGTIWISTDGGITKYQQPKSAIPPQIFVQAVIADRRYRDATDLSFSSQTSAITFEFHSQNFKTRPEAMVYRYRLKGHDQDWYNTHNKSVLYEDLPIGDYTFEVHAVDRDMVYSKAPATVNLTIHLPYERIGWMSALGIAIVLIAWQAVRIIHRNRALTVANREIQLQTERKSAFLASMSHELRTPITSMKGYVDNILDGIGGKANERHERYLNRVTDNATHLLSMVNDLLDLSKIAAGKMDVNITTFSVSDLITSCCNTVEPLVQPGVSLIQDTTPETAHTDEDKLRHIIGNLLSNAVKFTTKGEISVSAQTEQTSLVITVSDTGTGMPKEALDTIFDEFQQVDGSEQSQKGTGLGLAITKQYTELLGGTISVQSEVGQGTTFTVQIPLNHRVL